MRQTFRFLFRTGSVKTTGQNAGVLGNKSDNPPTPIQIKRAKVTRVLISSQTAPEIQSNGVSSHMEHPRFSLSLRAEVILALAADCEASPSSALLILDLARSLPVT